MNRSVQIARLACVLIASFISLGTHAHAVDFHDEDLGFSMSLPSEWKAVSEADLQNHPISAPTGGDAVYLGAYSRTGKLTPPMIIIEARSQPWSLEDASPSDIQKRLNLTPMKVLKDNGQFDYQNRYRGDNLSPAAYDAASGRIYVQGVMTGADGKPVYLYSVNFLGAADFVRVNCFAPVQDADSACKTFERITGSGAFDQGAAYEPPSRSAASTGYGWRRRSPLGAGIGLVIGAIIWWARRD